jgi:hypothetical protein
LSCGSVTAVIPNHSDCWIYKAALVFQGAVACQSHIDVNIIYKFYVPIRKNIIGYYSWRNIIALVEHSQVKIVYGDIRRNFSCQKYPTFSCRYIRERKVIIIDLHNETSVLVSKEFFFGGGGGTADCCLM